MSDYHYEDSDPTGWTIFWLAVAVAASIGIIVLGVFK